MKTTPLAALHESLGARMLPFAGWEMPIQYQGIVAEHKAVRESVGIFDISHMGQFYASGNSVADWLNSLLTNDTGKLGDGEGQYTLLLNEKGGVIDDMIIYRISADEFFLVVNAARIDEDWAWFQKHCPADITLRNESDHFAGVAVQGPKAKAAWKAVFPDCDLPEKNGILEKDDWVVCRTGYTGEDGFEFFSPADQIETWFQNFLDAGAQPCGLGARDSLRLEKCFPLNGSDLNESNTPLEAGLGFFVKLDKGCDFTGSDVLQKQKSKGLKQKLVALKATGKGPPPRGGYDIALPGGEIIGQLTSGGQSPVLACGIGMAYVPIELADLGTEIEVVVRDRRYPLEVVKKPFV